MGNAGDDNPGTDGKASFKRSFLVCSKANKVEHLPCKQTAPDPGTQLLNIE